MHVQFIDNLRVGLQDRKEEKEREKGEIVDKIYSYFFCSLPFLTNICTNCCSGGALDWFFLCRTVIMEVVYGIYASIFTIHDLKALTLHLKSFSPNLNSDFLY